MNHVPFQVGESPLTTCFWRRCIMCVVIPVLVGCDRCPAPGNAPSKAAMPSDDSKFFILLFPAAQSLQSIDGRSHSVDRAAIASLDELKGDTFKMYLNGKEEEFDQSCFSPTPNQDLLEKQIANLNKQFASWGDDTDWRSGKLAITKTEGEWKCSFTLKHRSGRSAVYHYSVDEESRVTPSATVPGSRPLKF